MKRVVTRAVVGLVVVLGIVCAGAYTLYRRASEPFQGFQAEQVVEIPPGTGPRGIGRRLVAAGLVRDELTFRIALWRSGSARRLQAGEYRFDRPLSAIDVIGKIARGEVDLHPLTFREGLTIAEMAKVFEASGLGTLPSFMEAAGNAALVHELDPAAGDLEGYLFPDTYALPRSADAARVVQVMVDRFRQVMSDDLIAAAKARGLSIRQLVTLASLVEKETALPEERPIVAAVYANRLRIGMGLQCDPTVIYALQLEGRFDGNLRREDLAIDSPYNTYRYPGLPPGPIAAPGKGSLEAAARPADVDYLYFVSRNDGSHEFAETLGQHNRNVQKYQIQYFRQRRR
jgi:UPF0755 protein